ncbi:hypothetical protein KP509_22G007800 [Ceratopteris richardii]|uniref:Uncharacterized protein n=1 Tax=Ceratopteris richardii TaxID=49495 RepID=A0A8T2S5R7_CERRI|nr:hypothetical protein KP509_22G007800 [Ceratopteris richardii]
MLVVKIGGPAYRIGTGGKSYILEFNTNETGEGYRPRVDLAPDYFFLLMRTRRRLFVVMQKSWL